MRRLKNLYSRFKHRLLRRLWNFTANFFPKQPDMRARKGRRLKLYTDYNLVHRGIVVIGKTRRTRHDWSSLRHHSLLTVLYMEALMKISSRLCLPPMVHLSIER